MNKFSLFAIAILLACLLLGTLFSILGVTNLALGATSIAPTVESIIVTTREDEVTNDGNCSLREAIQAANNNQQVDACAAGGVLTDTIIFDVEGIITVNSQLLVTDGGPLIIDGGGVITTSGGGTTRVWWVDSQSNLTMKDLAVVDGYVINDDGAGLYNNGGDVAIIQSNYLENHFSISDSTHHYGGGIYSVGGILNVLDSRFEENGSDDRLSHGGGIADVGTSGQIMDTTFRNNNSVGCSDGYACFYPGGGGIYLSNSTVMIQDSTFISNTSLAGGGVYNGLGSVTITNTTFTGNSGQSGGSIWNHGSMTISNSTISDNHVSGAGGGIYNNHDLTIANSAFTGNSSGGGGAIFNSGDMSITDSTFSGNSSSSGGAIFNGDHLLIANSTFSGNSAQDDGGGIANIPRVPSIFPISITNSTFNENNAGENGGGIYNSWLRLVIVNSTISANSAKGGGGVFIEPNIYFTIPVTLTNTILANNMFGDDCNNYTEISDGGHNISSDETCGFDLANGSMPNTDPMLGTLQDNGGPTWTRALLWGSPAIDNGDNGSCPTTDQRGVFRPLDGNWDGVAMCDIGSYEFVSSPINSRYYLAQVFKQSELP